MKKLIDYLSSKLGISNRALLEKEIILHKLLRELSNNPLFRENFVFKGGTCLIKCYFDYYRFSEDLDFSWKNQQAFSLKSQKEIRRALSAEITAIIQLLGRVAQKLHLNFKPDKSNTKYIELGGSNKFSTFKLWYRSEMSGTEQFVKIQINFLELFLHPFNAMPAKSLVQKLNHKEFAFLFPEEAETFLSILMVDCYSLSEILVEKFRAILTRRDVKARDFVDVFVITGGKKVRFQNLRTEIIRKTAFMLRYDKYVQNLRDFNVKRMVLGEEQKLLLHTLDGRFEPFLQEMQDFISSIAEELQKTGKPR